MAGYDRFYFLKKAWPLYPGIVRPVSATFLHTHYAERRQTRTIGRAALDALIGLLFHAWIPWRALRVGRKFGFDLGWTWHAIRIAHARFADPNDIALFRIERPEQLASYIRRFEDAALNKRINPLGWGQDCALADKQRFAERCQQAGLPHPETIAIAGPMGRSILCDPAGRSLIAKPIHGEGGDGFTALGPAADSNALEMLLSRLPSSPGRSWIVQPLASSHPALADIVLKALPTVRIVTILNEAGIPETVSATFRCAAAPDALVDNMKAGGLIAPVDLARGELGLACLGYGGGNHAVHPVTGGAVAGRLLPDWPAATDLAIRAHTRAFPEYALIGWDVALTGRGPILIEGNAKPGILMPQRAARHGLGEGRYGILLAHHLATKS